MEVGAEHGKAGAGAADCGGEGGLEGLGEVDFAGFFAEAAVEAGGIGEVEPGPIGGAEGTIGGVGGIEPGVVGDLEGAEDGWGCY